MQARTDRRSSCSAEICFAGAPSCVCFPFIQGSPLRLSTFMRAMLFYPLYFWWHRLLPVLVTKSVSLSLLPEVLPAFLPSDPARQPAWPALKPARILLWRRRFCCAAPRRILSSLQNPAAAFPPTCC